MSGLTFKGIIEGKQSKLEEKINVDAGLLSRLEEYRIITDRQRHRIEVILLLLASCNRIIEQNL